jgi:hypothetical protein
MKDQVTSIEQSKRLIELGVPAEKASMVWEYWINQDFSKDVPEEVFYNLNTKTNRGTDSCDRDIPAFTVADLLGMIKPIDIGPDTCNPCLEKMGNEGVWIFEFGQILGDEDFGYAFNHSLIDLLADRIEWIVSNGYGLNL